MVATKNNGPTSAQSDNQDKQQEEINNGNNGNDCPVSNANNDKVEQQQVEGHQKSLDNTTENLNCTMEQSALTNISDTSLTLSSSSNSTKKEDPNIIDDSQKDIESGDIVTKESSKEHTSSSINRFQCQCCCSWEVRGIIIILSLVVFIAITLTLVIVKTTSTKRYLFRNKQQPPSYNSTLIGSSINDNNDSKKKQETSETLIQQQQSLSTDLLSLEQQKPPENLSSSTEFQTILDILQPILIDANVSIIQKGSYQHQAIIWLSKQYKQYHDFIENQQYHFNDNNEIDMDNNSTTIDHENTLLFTEQDILHRYVLATFYFATNGKSWNSVDNNDNDDENSKSNNVTSRDWLLTSTTVTTSTLNNHNTNSTSIHSVVFNSVCDWEGVTCQYETDTDHVNLVGGGNVDTEDNIDKDTNITSLRAKIVQLELPGYNLVGNISQIPEISLLSDLQSLIVSNNYLKGTIPTHFGKLTNLKRLEVHSNHLSGAVPIEITNQYLSELQIATFHNNEFDAGLRNFQPCEETPKRILSADCWNEIENDNGTDYTSTTSSNDNTLHSVLCPCCTVCCRKVTSNTTIENESNIVNYNGFNDNDNGVSSSSSGIICIEQIPETDPKTYNHTPTTGSLPQP